ncbi:MAG: AP2 domain-containing protein [Lactobacillus sp.]|jgi:hypothetical protein|nr:AP2 domain-containing protein [Paucilactobacillus vaccinostercus]RRG09924.1 MAG: AP2 domain-containing protein [Lactobacillus sp.]
MTKAIDLSGQRFGRLVAIKPQGKSTNGNLRWLCRCDCGNYTEVDGVQLRRGDSKSCGCLRREVMRKQYRENPAMDVYRGKSDSFYNKDGVSYASIKRSKRNRSGIIGVSYDEKTDRWLARLMFHGKYVLLKSFETFDEAAEARQQAEAKYLKKNRGTKQTSKN